MVGYLSKRRERVPTQNTEGGIMIGKSAVQPVLLVLALMLGGGSAVGFARLSIDPDARPGAWTADMDKAAMQNQRELFRAQVDKLEAVNTQMIKALQVQLAGVSGELLGLREELQRLQASNASYYNQVVPGMRDILHELKREHSK